MTKRTSIQIGRKVPAVQAKAESAKQAADEKIEQTAEAQKDMVAGKLETMGDHLNEAFGSDIDTSSAIKSANVDEYKLRVAKEDTAREVEMAQTVSFTLIHLGYTWPITKIMQPSKSAK